MWVGVGEVMNPSLDGAIYAHKKKFVFTLQCHVGLVEKWRNKCKIWDMIDDVIGKK